MSQTDAHSTVLNVTLNGEQRRLAGPLVIDALLDHLGLDTRKVAVERNQAIVSKSQYASTQVESGDALEIVHFIGGG
jgi:thiamine biosynthesis protein ThiS